MERKENGIPFLSFVFCDVPERGTVISDTGLDVFLERIGTRVTVGVHVVTKGLPFVVLELVVSNGRHDRPGVLQTVKFDQDDVEIVAGKALVEIRPILEVGCRRRSASAVLILGFHPENQPLV